MQTCSNRYDAKEMEDATWTIFCELIDNIFSHSETQLNGYAALQSYQRGQRLRVAVSDSGLGIMETLRPRTSKMQPGRGTVISKAFGTSPTALRCPWLILLDLTPRLITVSPQLPEPSTARARLRLPSILTSVTAEI